MHRCQNICEVKICEVRPYLFFLLVSNNLFFKPDNLPVIQGAAVIKCVLLWFLISLVCGYCLYFINSIVAESNKKYQKIHMLEKQVKIMCVYR